MRWLLAAAVLLAIGLGMFGVVPPERAAACTIAPANLEQSAQYAELIVVGEVVSERSLPQDGYDSRESTIAVAAVLKGSAGDEITIAPTGWLGADCGGNPRLLEGERVLLFLDHSFGPLRIMGYEGGKYVIDDGNVRSTYAEPSQFPAAGAIRRVAQLAGSTPGNRDAALLFAVPSLANPTEASNILGDPGSWGERSASAPEDSTWAVGPLIVVAVVLLGTIVLAGTMLARGRAR
jgi:hypothetical protein